MGDLDRTVEWDILDLSKWQTTNVDFYAMKKAGIKGVILRINNADKAMTIDPCFEYFYSKAKEVGLYVGAYWFTRATSLEYGKMEAETCIKWLKGKQFDLPIFFDMEGHEQFDLGSSFCTSLSKQFCEILQNAMFFVGNYSSTFWFTNCVAKSVREKYCCWIAEWGSKCTYTGQYGMWQNNNVARYSFVCNGSCDVDHSFCYVDYPTAIKNRKRNGYGSECLDCTEVWKYGQADWGIYSLKRALIIAYKKCICDVKVTDSMVYDDTVKNAVDNLLKKWGYANNGILGSNFIVRLYNEIEKVMK